MSVIKDIESGKLEVQIVKRICKIDDVIGLVEVRENALSELLRLAEIGERMQWIPVSERLPESEDIAGIRWECVNVICETPAGNRFVTSASYQVDKNGKAKWMQFDGARKLGYKVLAWMPLPEAL